jgi:glutamate--cysteine ligase
MEGEFIIGAELDGQSVTLEPGGQFELSGALLLSMRAPNPASAHPFPHAGAPVSTLHMTCAEVNSHLYQARRRAQEVLFLRLASPAPTQVKTLAEEIGVAFLGLGFQPKWSVADTPAMPKVR